MISIVNTLMESAGKLLCWVDESLHFDVAHLKGLCKDMSFFFKHLESSFDHILLQFIVNDFNFTSCVVVRLQNWRLFVLLHGADNSSGWILLSLGGQVSLCSLSIIGNAIYLLVDFPMHLLMILTIDLIVIFNIQRQHFLAQYNHHYPSRLPGFDLNLEVCLLLLQNL